jgi:hypothetical protein
MSGHSFAGRLFSRTSSKSPQHFYEQGQEIVENPNHRQICKVIALHLSVNVMCMAIALRIRPWLGRSRIQLYVDIVGPRCLQLNFGIELLYRAILMETDDNCSNAVISRSLHFKVFHVSSLRARQ